MRSQCIDILYAQVAKELPVTREQYESTLIDWDIQPLMIGDANAGVVMLRDHEIHVVIDQYQAMQHGRKIIRKCLDENIEKHGYLTTISFKEPTIARFLERIGFHKTGEDDMFYSYRIDHKFKRNQSCHQ